MRIQDFRFFIPPHETTDPQHKYHVSFIPSIVTKLAASKAQNLAAAISHSIISTQFQYFQETLKFDPMVE